METLTRNDISLHAEKCSCGNVMNVTQEYERKICTHDSLDRLSEIIKIAECPSCQILSIILYYSVMNVEDIWERKAANPNFNIESIEKYHRKLLYSSNHICIIAHNFKSASIN